MIIKKIGLLFFIFLTFFITCELGTAGVSVPILKWQYGGCYSSWCETGWYSSPAVADLDNDGANEVIGSAYSAVVLNGATGDLKWRVKSQGMTAPSLMLITWAVPGLEWLQQMWMETEILKL